MSPAWITGWLQHGVRGGMVAGVSLTTGIVTAAERMPYDWEWLLIVCAFLGGFWNGTSSYKTEPK